MELTAFDHCLRTRLVFGAGAAAKAGELCRELGARRVLLVTDEGLVRAGHAAEVRKAIEAAGLEVRLHSDVRENPTTEDVEACVQAAREAAPDLFVALGGGSVIDTAKGANFLLTNGGRMQDYWGVGKASKPMRPLIAIPTTAGTGSEVQCAALIADALTHQKMACLDLKATPAVAILDPNLTVSLPRRVTAASGLDALVHAIESAVTTRRNAISSLYAREAFRLGADAFGRVLATPGDLEARGAMLLASAFAGIAIENSMLGAAHAAANPLTAHFNITHGLAVALMLPWVVRFNAEVAQARMIYVELARTARLTEANQASEHDAVERLIQFWRGLLRDSGLETNLAAFGIRTEDLPQLANEASKQWTARFNPRPIAESDFLELYRLALGPQRPSSQA